MDLARNVFAVHVDLIMVGPSSQLYDVAEMKQHFTMKVTPPLSASTAQTYVVQDTCDTATPYGSCRLPSMYLAC